MSTTFVCFLDSKEENSSRFDKFIWTTLHNSTYRRGQQGGWGHHSLDGGLPSGSQIIIKKRTKKRFSSSVSYFFLPTRPPLMQCLHETRVSNTEWRKSLVRGLSFFLSEIGQVTLKVEPGVCTDSFIFSWSLTIVTIVRQDRSPLLRRQPSSHLSKSSLGRPGVSKYKDKETYSQKYHLPPLRWII